MGLAYSVLYISIDTCLHILNVSLIQVNYVKRVEMIYINPYDSTVSAVVKSLVAALSVLGSYNIFMAFR